ncbi:MAG: hypothetical protein BWY68_00489 [bacterium ADurb.Bin400]|nr:MAG: hypothetical protein BWY68_00489 [bacterium ADurb.Bin400]
MQEIIYLEPDDEITSVIDRLKASTSVGVALVIPRGSSLAQSLINLKILKRSAEELGREVSLVVTDRITRNLASQLGITVYSKVSEAEHSRPILVSTRPAESKTEILESSASGIRVNTYNRYSAMEQEEVEPTAPIAETVDDEKIGTTVEASEVVEQTVGDAEDVTDSRDEPEDLEANEPVVNKHGGTMIRGRRGKSRKPLMVFATISLIVLLSCSYLLLPYASASVKLKTEDYSKELELVVERDLKSSDVSRLAVAGVLFSVEKEIAKNFPATSKKNIGEKARGKITVYNSYDSKTHKFAKGTKLTSNGKVFVADEEFTVGAGQPLLVEGKVTIQAGEGMVNVTAEQSGESYNLAPSTYVIEGAPSQITGKGGQLSGGTTKEVKLVGEKDLDTAEEELRKELTTQLTTELLEKVSKEGYRQIDGSTTEEIVSVSFSKSSGDEAENFDATIKSKVFTLGFKEDELRRVAVEAISAQLDANKMLIKMDSSAISFEVVESNRDLAQQKLKVTYDGKISNKMSENEIKSKIKNTSVAKAKQAFDDNESVEQIDIAVWPKFINRLPLMDNRIKVSFDYSE